MEEAQGQQAAEKQDLQALDAMLKVIEPQAEPVTTPAPKAEADDAPAADISDDDAVGDVVEDDGAEAETDETEADDADAPDAEPETWAASDAADNVVVLPNGQKHKLSALVETFQYVQRKNQELADQRKQLDGEREEHSKLLGIAKGMQARSEVDPVGLGLDIIGIASPELRSQVEGYLTTMRAYDPAKRMEAIYKLKERELDEQRNAMESRSQQGERAKLEEQGKQHLAKHLGRQASGDEWGKTMGFLQAYINMHPDHKDPLVGCYEMLHGKARPAKKARGKVVGLERPGKRNSNTGPSEADDLAALGRLVG